MSETKGRCYNETKASRDFSTDHLVIADAIDRLAADVASIKAKVDAVSPEDVRHFVESEKAWVKLVEEQRDAAIRERDQERAEVERLKAIVHSDAGHMAKILIENERLRAGPAASQPAAVSDAQPAAWGLLRVGGRFVDSFVSEEQAAKKRLEWNANENWEHEIVPLYAAPQPAGQGISPKVADTQPTGNAAPAAGWLTEEERELLALLKHTADGCSMVHSPWRPNWPYARMSRVVNALLSRAGSPPEQAAAEWLTDEERRALSRAVHLLFSDDCDTPSAGTVQALLSRAGSPPVVVLPTVFARSLLGDELVALQQVKDSLDKVGVAWREVPRE